MEIKVSGGSKEQREILSVVIADSLERLGYNKVFLKNFHVGECVGLLTGFSVKMGLMDTDIFIPMSKSGGVTQAISGLRKSSL